MLTDEMLLDSYHMAVELKLEREFITLLLAEIHKRNLDTDSGKDPALIRFFVYRIDNLRHDTYIMWELSTKFYIWFEE